MATDVTMPRLSDSMEEGTILKWLVSVGDEVKRGQELVEIETDKANMTYESDTDGALIEIVADEGDTLPIGEVIARIGDPSEAKEGAEGNGGQKAAEGESEQAEAEAEGEAEEGGAEAAGEAEGEKAEAEGEGGGEEAAGAEAEDEKPGEDEDGGPSDEDRGDDRHADAETAEDGGGKETATATTDPPASEN